MFGDFPLGVSTDSESNLFGKKNRARYNSKLPFPAYPHGSVGLALLISSMPGRTIVSNYPFGGSFCVHQEFNFKLRRVPSLVRRIQAVGRGRDFPTRNVGTLRNALCPGCYIARFTWARHPFPRNQINLNGVELSAGGDYFWLQPRFALDQRRWARNRNYRSPVTYQTDWKQFSSLNDCK